MHISSVRSVFWVVYIIWGDKVQCLKSEKPLTMKDEILYRYFAGAATSQETEQIEGWLAADASNQKEFDRAHLVFNVMTLHGSRFGKRTLRGRLLRVGRIAMRAAAVVALIVCAGYIGGRIENGMTVRRMSETMQVIEVPAGQRMSMLLADGTEVFLNGGSRLEYPLLFSKDRRRVKLSGEALFKVAHNASHPFSVGTFASEIEVLGTEFDVYADEENNRFSTVLVEGRVRVTNLLDVAGQQIEMCPNEQVSMIDGRLVIDRDANMEALCWVDGYINVAEIGFDELMERFENAYDVRIVIERATMPQIGFASGKIRVSEGVDFALKMLQRASCFTYTTDEASNTITIR